MSNVSKDDQISKYEGFKRISLVISDIFLWASEGRRSEKINICGDCLVFLKCHGHGIQKLSRASFCRERMCPMCQFRKSRKIAQDVSKVCHYALQENPTYKFLFLTLTVPNVYGDQLSETITHMFKSWKRLSERTEIKKILKGFFRALEVTYNPEKETYHPHFHIILYVPSNYFTKNYIKRDRWLELWQESTKQPEITQVDIRKIFDKNSGSDELAGAVSEVAKYTTKPFDFLLDNLTMEDKSNILMCLQNALANRRLHTYGGILSDIKRVLKLKDAESKDANLTDVDGVEGCFCPVCKAEMVELLFKWHHKMYLEEAVLGRPKKLVDAERNEDSRVEFEEKLGKLSESPDTEEEYLRELGKRIGDTRDGPLSNRGGGTIIID